MFCTNYAMAGGFRVAPVEQASDARLMPAAAWPGPSDDAAQTLIKISYLRGLLDALQYIQLAPQSSAKALDGLAGMSLQELARAVDDFYQADPNRKNLPPAAVVLRVLPGLKDRPEPGKLK